MKITLLDVAQHIFEISIGRLLGTIIPPILTVSRDLLRAIAP